MNTLPSSFGFLGQVTLSQLLDPYAKEHWRKCLYDNKLLVLKGLANLTKDQLWDIHTVFGTPWTATEYKDSFEVPSCESPGKFVTTYSNINSKGRIGNKGLPFHHDIPWHREKRYPIRSLYVTKLSDNAKDVTTEFCDCDAIWNRLPVEEHQTLLDADIRLQYWYDASKGTPNPETKVVPLVEAHPYTLRNTLLLNSFGPLRSDLAFATTSTGAWIVDCWSRSKQLGLPYLNKLHKLVCTDDNTYSHRWEFGDLVLFDNYSGVFHGRKPILVDDVEREFWRMNVKHNWQT